MPFLFCIYSPVAITLRPHEPTSSRPILRNATMGDHIPTIQRLRNDTRVALQLGNWIGRPIRHRVGKHSKNCVRYCYACWSETGQQIQFSANSTKRVLLEIPVRSEKWRSLFLAAPAFWQDRRITTVPPPRLLALRRDKLIATLPNPLWLIRKSIFKISC